MARERNNMPIADGDEPGATKAPKTSGRYRKVEVRTWGDEKFRALSPIPPCGQGLWLFLITGPHTGPIPGLFRAGRAAMAEELGWETEAFDKAFGEAFGQGMVKADFKARVVWLPSAIRHNRPESPNVVRSWAAEFDLIPECDLKRDAYESLKASIHALGEAFGKAFDEAFAKPSAKPSRKAMANQEQEQKQEQKQEQDGGPRNSELPGNGEGTPTSAADAAATTRGTRLAKDWALPKAWGNWALSKYPQWSPDKVRDEALKFRNHWVGKTGKDATKLDWEATWQNWCMSELAHRDDPKPGKGAPQTQAELDAINAEAMRLVRGTQEAIDHA